MKRPLDTTLGSTIPDPPSPAERPDLATFAQPEQRFELGSELGRGGMGRVVAAKDVALGRSVAIKQILSDRSDDLVRFEREVRITAELEHPSIVPIYEAALDARGQPYYVMRRIEGEPLSTRLNDADLATRLALLPNLLAVVEAAAFAHARNIIHRDIKPSNILLGAYGETHLIDWGLARKIEDADVSARRIVSSPDQLTQVGEIYGTVGYMAPEQARGEPVDARADVYALGATLFHVLAGNGPFSRMSDIERLSAAATGDDRVPIDDLGPDISPELIAIVEKATAREPATRYPDASALATDLRAFLAGKLVAAHHYTPRERLRRFVRRHRVAVVLSAISLVMLVVISTLAISRVIRAKSTAEAERTAADQARDEALRDRQEAQNRAELLLIQRASTMAPNDPTRAAGLILQLPPTSIHAKRARDTIAKIAAFGLARGSSAHTRAINSLAFSPDQRSLASVGDDGLVVRHEVATGAFTVITNLKTRLYEVGWLDDRTLLVIGHGLDGLRLIDVADRTVRSLGHGVIGAWWRVGDRIRYHDETMRTLVETSLEGREMRELARDVIFARGWSTLAVYSTSTGLYLLNGEKVSSLGLPSTQAASVAFSPDGLHVAIGGISDVVEMEVATGRRTNRWEAMFGPLLAYQGRTLLRPGGDGQISSLTSQGRVLSRMTRGAMMWQTRISTGVVFASDAGTLLIVDDAGVHTLVHDYTGSRVIGGTPDGMLVAVGSKDGRVRWIDLEHVTPRPYKLGQLSTLCTSTTRFLYVFQAGSLVEIDRQTGATRTVAEDSVHFGVGANCGRVTGSRLNAFSPFGLTSVDLSTGKTDVFHDAAYSVTDVNSTLFAAGSDVFELPDDGSTRRKLLTAPSAIHGIAALGDRIAVLLTSGRLLIFDRQARLIGETAIPKGTTGWGMFPDGGLWYAHDSKLFTTAPNRAPKPLYAFSRPVVWVVRWRDRYFARLDDGTLWDVRPPHGAQRSDPGLHDIRLGATDLAVTATTQSLNMIYLASGEVVSRDFAYSTDNRLQSNGRTVLARIQSSGLIFEDHVPDELPDALHWLRQQTNVEIDKLTEEMTWR